MAAEPPRSTRWLAASAFAGYAFLVASLVLRHEIWRDEADAWLIVRDANPGEILHRLGYMGTPGLWYLILFPFAKLNLPVAAMQVIHAALAVIAGALILFRSPFRVGFRVLSVFGYYLSYEYAIVARSYVLDAVLLFTLACLRDPAARPVAFGLLVALLANANVHGLLLAIVLLVGLFDRMPRKSRSIAAAGVVGSIWQLWPPKDGQLTTAVIGFRVRSIPEAISRAFFPLEVEPVRIAAAVLVCALLVWFFIHRPRPLFLLVAGWAALLSLFAFVRGGAARYDGLLWLWAIFILWFFHREEPLPKSALTRRLLAASLLASGVVSLTASATTWSKEWRLPFSESQEMARYLRRVGLAGVPIAAFPAPQAEAVLAQLPPRRFWYLGIAEEGSYMKWDANFLKGLELDPRELQRRALDYVLGNPGSALLLSEKPQDVEGLCCIFATPGLAFARPEERYFLYMRCR